MIRSNPKVGCLRIMLYMNQILRSSGSMCINITHFFFAKTKINKPRKDVTIKHFEERKQQKRTKVWDHFKTKQQIRNDILDP